MMRKLTVVVAIIILTLTACGQSQIRSNKAEVVKKMNAEQVLNIEVAINLAEQFKQNEEKTLFQKNYEDNYKMIVQCEIFNVVYYYDTSELVCIRNKHEIGPRVKIDVSDIENINKMDYYGYISNETLIYPILIVNSEGISLNLYRVKEGMKPNEEIIITDSKKEIPYQDENIRYAIHNNNMYIIKNAQNLEIPYHSNIGDITILVDENIEIQEHHIE